LCTRYTFVLFFSEKPATGPREARAASKLLVAFPSEKKIVPQDIGSVVEKMVPQLSAEVLAEVVASVIAELSKEGRIMEMASTPLVNHTLPVLIIHSSEDTARRPGYTPLTMHWHPRKTLRTRMPSQISPQWPCMDFPDTREILPASSSNQISLQRNINIVIYM